MDEKLIFNSQKTNNPQIMGILNVTPDSFSDGGLSYAVDNAVENAMRMVDDGADIIDVGGESTRPGADFISIGEEMDRVIPVIEKLAKCINVPISIDTRKPDVMQAAICAGAAMVNDVCALEMPGAIEMMRNFDVPICLMHMQGQPKGMQKNPSYEQVIAEIKGYLRKRILECEQAGIGKERIIIDPGFGFGKSVEHNYQIFANLPEFNELGCPIMIGVSRKSMIGAIINRPVEQRVYGSAVLAALAAMQGVSIIRVHDILATKDAIDVACEVKRYIT